MYWFKNYLFLFFPQNSVPIDLQTNSSSRSGTTATQEMGSGNTLPDQIEPLLKLSESHLNHLIDLLSGGETKSLTALDSCYSKNYIEAFDMLENLVNVVSHGNESQRLHLLQMVANQKEFLSKLQPAHMCEDSNCNQHSFKSSLDPEDEHSNRNKPINEQSFCDACQESNVIGFTLRLIINSPTFSLPVGYGHETRSSLGLYLTMIQKRLRIYNAHVIRKVHESDISRKLDDLLLDDTYVHLTMDWKMKILSMCWRESQTNFFGKRGIALMGLMATYLKSTEELAEEIRHGEKEPNKTKTIFLDLLSDDSSETGFLSAKCLEIALCKLKCMVNRLAIGTISTDGAGCFSGAPFLSFLPFAGALTGIKIVLHIVTEVGCGKSAADGHFSYIRHVLIQNVAKGKGRADFDSGRTAAEVLCLNGGIVNSFTCYVENDLSQYREAKPIKDLDLHLSREFLYEDLCDPMRCTAFKLSRMSFRDGGYDLTYDISELGNRDDWCKSTLSKASTELSRSGSSSSSSASVNLTETHNNVEDMVVSVDSNSRPSVLFPPQGEITPRNSSSVIVASSDVNDDVTGVHWITSTIASIIGEDHQILTWPGDSPFQQDNSTHQTVSTISDSSESMSLSESGSNASFDTTGENPTKEDIRAFKKANPKSLVVTTEDKNKKEKAKHNRKGQKLTRFLRVSVYLFNMVDT